MTPRLVSWSEFHEKCEELADMVAIRYQDSPERPSELCLVGILRGGAIVASVLSYLLERRSAIDVGIDVVGIRRYPSDVREPLLNSSDTVYHYPESPPPTDFVVLVDEVATTGITLDHGRRVLEGLMFRRVGESLYKIPKIHTACMFSVGQKFADDVVEVVPEGTWIFFPWDDWSEVDEGCGDHEAGVSPVSPGEGQTQATGR